jgi:hypothetical protein
LEVAEARILLTKKASLKDKGLTAEAVVIEVEVILAAHRNLPKEGKQAHFLMLATIDDANIEAVLIALAGESTGSARFESGSVALVHSGGGEKRICRPESARLK